MQEMAVDIGGGKGEYFVQRARENPEKTFLILEPSPLRLKREPPNLHVIRWRSDEESFLPLKAASVDEANINFLCGEIRDRDDDVGRAEKFEVDRYRKLLRDLKEVLKNGALVRIADVRGNIGAIKNLLEEEGYKITLAPIRLMDEDRTAWSKCFFDVFEKGGKSEEESVALPMTIEAQWE